MLEKRGNIPQNLFSMEKQPIRSFVLWLIQNVIVPLLPLFISVTVDYFLSVPAHFWTDETILVYAFVLPVVYLGDSRDALSNYGFTAVIIVGIFLYTAVHVHNHQMLPSLKTNLIYHLAIVLDLIYIVTA